MNITAQQLSGEHIGKKFTIEGTPGIRTIHGYAKYTSRVELQCTHPTGREVALILLPNTPITIQEGQCIGQSGNTGAFAREPIQETSRKKIERNTQEGQW